MLSNIISKLSVRWRLMGFIIFLLLMMTAAGTGGILGMKTTKQSLSKVYQKHVQPMEQLRQINELFKFEITGTVERILYEQITWKDARSKLLKTNADIGKQFAIIEKTKSGFFSDIQDSEPNFESTLADDAAVMIGKLLDVIQTSDMDQLDGLFNIQLEPFQQEFESRINSMILARVDAVRKEYETAELRYKKSSLAFLITIITGVSIGLLAGYILMRSIDIPLARMTRAMSAMTKGNLSTRIDYESSDELGDLIRGFNQLQDYLTELVSQIQTAGIHVTSSITEIAASTKEQEASSNEHAATANEIAASTSQIAATSENLLDTMKKVNNLTNITVRAAEDGHAGLADIDATMVKMEDSTGSIVAKLSVLNEKAGDIASVVKTINKVADQTNLLSLNAAIEAEKAGEYGTGFAVVATEIRRLADQTAVATYDIEQMVQGVQSAVSAAVMGIDKFAEDVRASVKEIRNGSDKMEDVINNVQVLTPQVALISEGIEAQSLGARQISDATSQLNEAAQQTADSISQMGSTIFQLQKAAQGLQEAITRFRI
jgi:methyl-accepting chemotaxis protein WspA